jgi:glycosyltransferase involved in cell wall biosynthesis
MNILFMSEVFFPHGSGAEYATYLYANLLKGEGVNVAVITNRFEGEAAFSEDGLLRIYRLSLFKNAGSLKYSVLKRLDLLASSFLNKMLGWADVVYFPRFWFPAIALAKAHGKPVVVHMHDYISVCSLSSLFDETKSAICPKTRRFCSPKCVYSFERAHSRNLVKTFSSVFLNTTVGSYIPKLSRLADAVICVSTRQKELLVERERAFQNKSYVVYNPFPDYSNLEVKGQSFGYFGGPDPLKGFNVLYYAASKINKRRSKSLDIQCTKFNTTNLKFAGEIRKLGFRLHKRLEIPDLENLYMQLKSVLVPSIWNEPWPYTIVEALLRRRFVVASRIGGMPEQVEGCKGAILVEPGDSKMLAEAIEYVMDLSKEEVVDLGSQNREVFLSRFNNYSSVRKFINLCENLD